MKRTNALITAAAMLFSCAAPALPAQAETLTEGNFTYEITADGSGAVVTGFIPAAQAQTAEIPSELGGLPVTGIGDDAFRLCDSLSEITLPDSLTSIGNSAFSFCDSLTALTIPANVSVIGAGVFEQCSALQNIRVAEDNAVFCDTDGMLCSKDGTVLLAYPCGRTDDPVIPEGIRVIGETAFCGCGMTGITLPEGLTVIGMSAFRECTNLTELRLPDSLAVIEGSAFLQCDGLSKVTLPENLAEIGEYAFESCGNLTEITVPANVTEIGRNAFVFCENLKNIFVAAENAVYSDADGILYSKDGSELIEFPAGRSGEAVIPAGTRSVAPEAFARHPHQIAVVLPDGLEIIGSSAFWSCYQMDAVTIPESTKVIGAEAFLFCTGLSSVTVPAGVDQIGDSAFGKTENLTLRILSARAALGTDLLFDSSDPVIEGYTGSTAEKYAESSQIPFRSLGDIPADQTGTAHDSYLPGDADCSGDVQIADAILLARYLAEDAVTLTPVGRRNANCYDTGRSELSADDLQVLLQYLAGCADFLPVEPDPAA